MLDLGDIRFGFTADLSGIQRAHKQLRQWARDVNSIVARTDDLSVSLQHAATKQEQSIRHATEQVKQLNAALRHAGAPSPLASSNNKALERLRTLMKSGQLGALDYARANDKFAISMNRSKRALVAFKDKQRSMLLTEKEAATATTQLARQVEGLQLSMGGAEAATVKQARAQKILGSAVKAGIIDLKRAEELQVSYGRAASSSSKKAGASVGSLRRKIESLQIASGGAAAAQIKMGRAQETLNVAVREGVITQSRAVAIEDTYALAVNRSRESTNGLTAALMAMRSELSSLRKIAFTLNSLVAALYFVTEGLKVTIGAAAEFQESMVRVRNLTGQSAKQIKQWAADIIKLAPEVAVVPAQLADTFQFVGGSISDVSKTLATVKAVAEGAAIGLGEVADVGRTVVSVMNVFPRSMGSASKVLGVLIAAISRGEATGPEFAASLGQVIATAKKLGVSFNDVAASIAVFTNQGLTAQKASILLENLLRAVLKPSSEAAKALNNMYLGSQQLSAGFLQTTLRTKGLQTMLLDLSKAAGGSAHNAESLAKVLGSIRAERAVFGLLVDGGREMASVFKTVETATAKVFFAAFGREAKTAAFQLRQASTAIRVALLQMSRAILPATAKLAGGFAKNIQTIIHWVELLGGILLAYFIGRVLTGLNRAWISGIAGIVRFKDAFRLAAEESTVAARGFAIAATTLKGAIGLLGGPLGVIAIAIGLIWQITSSMSQARQKALAYANSIDIAAASLRKLSLTELKHEQIKIKLALQIENKKALHDELSAGLTYWQKIKQAFHMSQMYPVYNHEVPLSKRSALPTEPLLTPKQLGFTDAQTLNRINLLDKDRAAVKRLATSYKAVSQAMASFNSSKPKPTKSIKLKISTTPIGAASALSVRTVIALMQKYIDKVKVQANAVLQSNEAKAKAKAALEAQTIAQKEANGNIKETTALLKALAPQTALAAAAWKEYYDSQDVKKAEKATANVQHLIDKLRTVSSLSRRQTFIQQQVLNARHMYTAKGIKDLSKYAKELKKVGKAAAAAFDARQLQGYARQAASGMQNAFAQFFMDPFKDGLHGLVRAFAHAIEEMIAQMLAFKTMQEIFGGKQGWAQFIGSIFGAVAGSGGNGGVGGSGVGNTGTTFAKFGAAFDHGNVVKMALGKVVNSPTFFPLAGNSTGLMGEAGPEAVMPLTRGPGGHLGIRAVGGRTVINAPQVNIDARGAGPDETAKIISFGAKLRQIMQSDYEHFNTYGAWPV